jgi:membrane-bound ClpP family serine protease
MIKRNIGTIDQVARLIAGASLLIIAFTILDAADAAAGGIVLAVIGALLIMTAATGFCIGYKLFNFSTKK